MKINRIGSTIIMSLAALLFSLLFLTASAYANTDEGETPILNAPKITNVDATGTKVTVTWEKDPLATSYNLTVGDENLVWYAITEYKISGNSNSYTFKYEDYCLGQKVALSLQSIRDAMWSEETKRTFTLLDTPALRAGLQTNSNAVQLCWNNVSGALSYDIYRYDEKEKRFIFVDDVGTKVTSFTDTNRQPSTNYRYKIQARDNSPLGGKKDIKSAMSNEVSVYTHAQSAALNVKLKTKKAAVKLKKYPGKISDFFDHKGYYTIANDYGKYIYIRRFDANNLKIKKTIKIKKKYSTVGGVICDNTGNYYIAWGKYNSTENRKKVTFAISKYSYKGKHIKTAKGDEKLNVKTPFRSGGCAMTIDGNNLVCNFARQMYKASDGLNHQASQVFAVNTKTMKRVDSYYNYVSHSFSQRAITLRNGGVLFADLGDAYPRGFTLNDQKNGRVTPFHFYGALGNNYTNSSLGDVLEVSTGYVLVGTSGKSMKSLNGRQQLFMQLINPHNGKSILNASKREGTSCGNKKTNVGVQWLTNYKDGSAIYGERATAIDKDRILIIWERSGGKKKYSGTYYMILTASGKVLKKATRLSKSYIAPNGAMDVRNEYIYWTSWEGDYIKDKYKINIHRLKVN